jgi:SNF2 family DNA or RNA helicase
MLTEKAKAKKERTDQASTQDPTPEAEDGAREEGEDDDDDDAGGSFGLTFKFRKFLRALKESRVWPELHSRSICSKCRSIPDSPYVTSCFHVYCKECLTAMAYESSQREEQRVSCLECGTLYDEASRCRGLEELGFNSPSTLARVEKHRNVKNSKATKKKGKKSSAELEENSEEEDIDWIDGVDGAMLPSSKTTATKALILTWLKKDPNTKIIIYTQFLDMIRILQKMCTIEGWKYVTFTGKMTFDARDKSIATFRDDPGTSIMLCSLKAGGVGLNLTMASKVIILDLWFNSSVESQAYCRAFRIGQQKKVEVVRFVVQDSIDEDLISMQERKVRSSD